MRCPIPHIFLMLLTFMSCGQIWAQSFDEEFSIWPRDLKINGTVCVSSDPNLPGDLNELFLNAAGGDQARILVLDFADGDFDSELTSAFESAGSIDVKKVDQDLISGGEESIAKIFVDLKGVWLYSDAQLDKKQTKILDLLKDSIVGVVNRGGVVCASGPVATRLGRYKHETMMGMSLVSDELGLIPDAVVYTQYNDAVNRNNLLSSLAANPNLVGIGVQPGTAFMLNGRKIRVYGQGQTTFALMANEQQPLRIQHVKQATSGNSSPYETIVDLTAWRRDAIERRLRPFPPPNPPQPFVENGTLFIVGGGDLPEGLMKRFVEMAGGEKAKLIYGSPYRTDCRSDRHLVWRWTPMEFC